MVPPIKLWDQGVPCEQALKIMTRNSRMPESLAADLDAECSACLMGARRMAELFERYGKDTVEACFDAVLDKTTATFRREILSKIPVGEYVWEDYAEHDGVEDPKLHTQRITLTKTRGRRPRRRAADPRLPRHRAAGQGPDQPLRRLRRRQLPEEVAGADPAQPRRHPGADGRARRQRGRRAADRDAVPAEGHAADARVPGAHQRPHVRDPAAARRAGRRARQGRRRPDAGRPGDDPLHRRLRHRPGRRAVPHARGARRRLRRSLLRRRRGHHPRRARLPQPAVGVLRGALPVHRRAARPRRRQRRRRALPRRTGLREAHPDAQGRALHVDRGPVDPVLLGRQGRQGRPAVRGGDRPGRAERARGRRPRRRRAGGRRRGDPDPDHRRRRLGRPAGAAVRRGRARRAVGQGVARGRARRLRRRRHRRRRRARGRRRGQRRPARRAARGPRARGQPAVLRPRPGLRHPRRRRHLRRRRLDAREPADDARPSSAATLFARSVRRCSPALGERSAHSPVERSARSTDGGGDEGAARAGRQRDDRRGRERTSRGPDRRGEGRDGQRRRPAQPGGRPVGGRASPTATVPRSATCW